MPELPEVETVRRGLALRLEGRIVTGVKVRRRDLRQRLPARFAERIVGRRIGLLGRRAKYLLLPLDDGTVLILHLGMSGRLVLGRTPAPPPAAHDHVRFETDDGTLLTFNDPRRFGLIALCAQADLGFHPLLRHLGPEPLDPDFDGPALARRLAGKRTAIKAALLDQRVVAGVGNIYACEALHRARLSPLRRAGTVSGDRAQRLAGAIRAVLEEAIAAGGSSLRDYVRADGELGYFQHRFAVYDRTGAACPGEACRGRIRRKIQAGRSSFYCPACQR